MRARFTPEGMQLEAKFGDKASPRIGMKVRSVGCGERLIGVRAARLTTSGSRIEYKRSLMGSDSAAESHHRVVCQYCLWISLIAMALCQLLIRATPSTESEIATNETVDFTPP
jgi:hypothetical protein